MDRNRQDDLADIDMLDYEIAVPRIQFTSPGASDKAAPASI